MSPLHVRIFYLQYIYIYLSRYLTVCVSNLSMHISVWMSHLRVCVCELISLIYLSIALHCRKRVQQAAAPACEWKRGVCPWIACNGIHQHNSWSGGEQQLITRRPTADQEETNSWSGGDQQLISRRPASDQEGIVSCSAGNQNLTGRRSTAGQ